MLKFEIAARGLTIDKLAAQNRPASREVVWS